MSDEARALFHTPAAVLSCCGSDGRIFRLTEDAREDFRIFAPDLEADFFRVVDARTKGRRGVRAVAIRADGSEEWRDARTFEVSAGELEPVA